MHRSHRHAAVLGTAALALGLGLAVPAPGVSQAAGTACPVPPSDVSGGVGSDSAGDPYFPADGNGGYDVGSYDIHVTYRPATDRLTGTAVLVLTPREDLERFSLDLVLDVDAVKVDGVAAGVARADAHDVRVTPATPLVAGEPATVRVAYHGTPSERTAEGVGPNSDLYFHSPGETVAMGEPQNGPWWFPANETPTDKARFDVTVRVPAGNQVVSNGTRRSQTTAHGWTTRHWSMPKPITTYLAFFAAGDFDVRSDKVDGRRYTYAVSKQLSPSSRDRAFTSLERTPRVLAWLAKRFGAYPYSSGGGVVTALRAGYALETATRPVYPGGVGDVRLLVHENAHQWFGDDVALCRWSDIWLNEGFATYAEWLWTESHGGETVDDALRRVYQQHGPTESFWDHPLTDPGASTMWDTRFYLRGAMTLAALRNRIGTDDLRTLLRDWADQQGGGHGTTAEFRALAEQLSGEDLGAFFQHWLDDAAKPDATPDNGLG